MSLYSVLDSILDGSSVYVLHIGTIGIDVKSALKYQAEALQDLDCEWIIERTILSIAGTYAEVGGTDSNQPYFPTWLWRESEELREDEGKRIFPTYEKYEFVGFSEKPDGAVCIFSREEGFVYDNRPLTAHQKACMLSSEHMYSKVWLDDNPTRGWIGTAPSIFKVYAVVA
ncbi:MAG: hypothetical protein GY861_21040 [bacterium]|nr:hypothetical protein [bacterium]